MAQKDAPPLTVLRALLVVKHVQSNLIGLKTPQEKNMQWQIEKIIEVANQLTRTGSTGASTGECIAAAFVLNEPGYLPAGYTIVEAWDRLDTEWQSYVRQIQRDYQHLIEGR
ncbi:MAG: hypothetical protein GY889_15110 [Proteobacteria bacterium]|nr:hypothetical protein [Pseudomonadota bacterium]